MLTKHTIRNSYAYCKDDISLIENYYEALNSDKKYCCHHRKGIGISHELLIEQGLYFHRPADELIFMEIGEHKSLHNKNLSEETKQKMSELKKGEKNPLYGQHHSLKTRQKMSDNHANFKGCKNPRAKEVTINGKTYGCLKDAHEDMYQYISYSTFTFKYRNNILL